MNCFAKLYKLKGYTQRSLAQLIKCGRSTIAMWCTGKSKPTYTQILKLQIFLKEDYNTIILSLTDNKTICIPASEHHQGLYTTTVTVRWYCPRCGGPRGKIKKAKSYDGSQYLVVDAWENPCGHIDYYADVRAEAEKNGLNIKTEV